MNNKNLQDLLYQYHQTKDIIHKIKQKRSNAKFKKIYDNQIKAYYKKINIEIQTISTLINHQQ